jgi:hypothetical protein
MNALLASTGSCILLAAVLLSPPRNDSESNVSIPRTSHWGQLTVTESLIRQEILRLDGDWESGAKPKLIAFLGQKFDSPKYEMLTHLPTVETFSAQECRKIDNFAIKCLSTIIFLKRLDFVRCEIDATCMSLLGSNRELREITFEEIQLKESVMDGITQLKQVETLIFNNVDLSLVSDDTIDRVSRMNSLKRCLFWDCRGMSTQRIEQLKATIPNVEWE